MGEAIAPGPGAATIVVDGPLAPNARIDGATRVLGVLGYPVAHTLSPIMYNAAVLAAGLDYCCLPFAVRPEALPTAVAGLRALDLPGWTVTIPHKQAVLPLLDGLSREAEAIGAVNCVVNACGSLVGHNTDAVGFVDGLRVTGWRPVDGPAVVLGAGGAARAVAWGLAAEGAETVVAARRPEQAAAMVAALRPYLTAPMRSIPLTHDGLSPWLDRASVLVNTTPLGMWPRDGASPVPAGIDLPPSLLAYDVVYVPEPTRFLREAAARGCRTQSGVAMLVGQGVAAFRLWTGQTLDAAVMERAVRDALAARASAAPAPATEP